MRFPIGFSTYIIVKSWVCKGGKDRHTLHTPAGLPHHDFTCNGLLMSTNLNAAPHPVHVTIEAAHATANYIRVQIISDIRDLAGTLNQSTQALGVNIGRSRPELLVIT